LQYLSITCLDVAFVVKKVCQFDLLKFIGPLSKEF
jgi:hypothetical protein